MRIPTSVRGSSDSLLMEPSQARMALAAVDPALEPITLEEAKKHLRQVFDDEDDYISSLIVAARQMAEDRLNRTLVQRVREVAACSWAPIKLLKPPFVQIESVSYFDAEGQSFDIDPADLTVSSIREPAKVSLRSGFQVPQLSRQDEAIIVRYTAGYPQGEVPRPIIQWMLLVIATMYDNRASVVNGVSTAALGDDFSKWLLQPYMVYE